MKSRSDEPRRIRILVAEDHLIARVGLTTIINMQKDMGVVAEAVNGRQAIDLYRIHVPDIVLIDVRMPVLGGIEAITAIHNEFQMARVIALSTYGGDEDIRRSLDAGAQAYLTKDVLRDELLIAIRAVHAGRAYLPATIRAVLHSSPLRANLSTREIQVLTLIIKGLANKQIAATLDIAEYTVKNHVKSILEKLDVGDRTQAATIAIERGIIHL